MSRGYVDRVNYASKQEEVRTATAEQLEETPRTRRLRGTGEFVQVKLSRSVYNALKTVASLSGKTVPEMLERFVEEGVDSFRSLTVEQLLSK